MAGQLADKVIHSIDQVTQLYYRLVMVVAPAGAGKTAALQGVRQQIGASLVNVNLELSRRMLDLTSRQRALQMPQLLREIIHTVEGEVVLLDNIELLFDVTLRQDPLRLLQGLSRNKTLVVAWNGFIDGGRITYAMPHHPEYRRYPFHDCLVVSPDPLTTKM